MLIDREDQLPCQVPALLDDWHCVAYSTDLAPGAVQSSRLLGYELVLWRDRGGMLHAWEDRCPHRGASLSRGVVVDDTVQCPYHGWRYGPEAICTFVPSAPAERPPVRARVARYQVAERYGLVWVCLGDPAGDVPTFPEWDDPAFRGFHAGPYAWHSSGYRAVENFVDATHFPFVHPDVNGTPDSPDLIPSYEVVRDGKELVTSEVRVYQPYGDPRNVPVLAGYSYIIKRPLVGFFSKRLQVANGATVHPEVWEPEETFCTLLAVQQVDETHCVVRIAVVVNYGPELTEADVRRRQDLVYEQDQYIVEMQRPRRMPTDSQAEIHHRTDKLGLAYRRLLRDLKIDYGTL